MNYLDLQKYEFWLISHSNYKNSKPYERIDYSYKSKILNTELCKDVGAFNYERFLNAWGIEELTLLDSKGTMSFFDELFDKFGGCAIMEANRLNNARYKRIQRLRARIESIFNFGCEHVYFLTFTFNEKELEKSRDFSLLRKYVQRFLKKNFKNYVGNIDFGKENGRVHFHAVACADYLDPQLWHFGNLDYELVLVNSKSNELMAKYITKLVNHAIKNTTKRNSLIYCRLKNFS